MVRLSLLVGLYCLALGLSSLSADEKLKDIACRSVHLGFPAPEGVAFYHEATVQESAEGTYFMVCGFSKGYFGIQELANGKKLILFSVWDPGSQDDPKTVPEEKKVKLLHKDDAVRVGRFGGEGTGGQSFFDYDWKVGTTYRFLVTAQAEDAKRTAYAGYFYLPENKEWKHLVTFSTLSEGKLLRGYYCFIEDFRRNRLSTTKPRTALFGNGWVQSAEGQWIALTRAQFTADSNPVLNINAKVQEDRYFLGTGGNLTNSDAKLRTFLNRPPTGVGLPALKLSTTTLPSK